ncbi:MAG TPA: pyridoxal-phosphate dependent enzyme [Caldithrix abyssi]|uniref:Pyridoxal-phosphate dependent enzyme n=1 Tax=Caldithrix abyssi TaxID=187145 RepID=A0A7V5UFA2_CALAY|nr:pyridoxal-phosphate dependent enzyme [Caldithrix abyssi]
MKAFGEKYGYRITWAEGDIHIVDGYVGGGYGVISAKEGELIRRLAEREGLIIDPVYGAKAFRGLEEKLKAGEFPGKNILFIHTGGVFGVFPYGDRL